MDIKKKLIEEAIRRAIEKAEMLSVEELCMPKEIQYYSSTEMVRATFTEEELAKIAEKVKTWNVYKKEEK